MGFENTFPLRGKETNDDTFKRELALEQKLMAVEGKVFKRWFVDKEKHAFILYFEDETSIEIPVSSFENISVKNKAERAESL